MKSVLVVTGWNCRNFVRAAFESIKKQSRKPDYIIIVDDGSTDGTRELLIQMHPVDWGLILLPSNHGTTYARDRGITATDAEVVILMDLDDELTTDAVKTVMDVYENDPEAWLTYGNMITNDGNVYFNSKTIQFEGENFREQTWKFIHLRTFRRALYDKLTSEDLFVKDTPVYPDANMLYCLLEMAGIEHIRALNEILYKYNYDHSNTVIQRFNDAGRRHEEHQRVKNMPPKQKLTSL